MSPSQPRTENFPIDDNGRPCKFDDKVRQLMKDSPNIGRAEMEVLRYVADHHPITVRDVADHLAETKGQVRTTALNMLERLRKKGYLARKRQQGVFHYSPRQPRGDLLQGLVRDFVDRALGGSLSPFVAYLTRDARITKEELEELKRLVLQLEQQQKGEKL